ncbi:hypothetical protein HanPSC8_Chr09g0385951 [Helianthus annuus]|nr:hypothetical protein HanPSC8_Chr09g0385951 [Helianthus annuus]
MISELIGVKGVADLIKEKKLLLRDFSKWVSDLSWLPETIRFLLELLHKRLAFKT